MTYEPGKYPKEYNPKVHGPYHPGRYYGKPDVPFGDVKIGDLGGWISRRKTFWNWSGRWMNARNPGFAPIGHIIMLSSTYYFLHCKYH
ncbi:unnamed protein product [Candidula unifasciata]|uniref:Uncharacterized protein n=1 Tax=Candidula unifasciata TaxID=100452 RepID=A0A8S3ZPQ6_9EUPU|nr:unnamed protein product [Candidula unifasciata]